MIDYNPFFQTIKTKKITQYSLITDYFVSNNTLNKMKKNESVTLKTIDYLCKILNCQISDIVSINN